MTEGEYRPHEYGRAEVQRILDREARRLLEERLATERDHETDDEGDPE